MDGAAARIGPRGPGLWRISGATPVSEDAPRGAVRRAMPYPSSRRRNKGERLTRGVPPGCPGAGRLLRWFSSMCSRHILVEPSGIHTAPGSNAPRALRRPDPQSKKIEPSSPESYLPYVGGGGRRWFSMKVVRDWWSIKKGGGATRTNGPPHSHAAWRDGVGDRGALAHRDTACPSGAGATRRRTIWLRPSAA